MSQMFQYEAWLPDNLYTVDDFIDGAFYRRNG